jgi:hypothetical protein
MTCFPAHIRSNEVRPVTLAADIHRVTVDEYIRIVRDFGWESTELVEGVVYDVTPEYSRHMGTVMHLFRLLDAWFPENATCNTGTVRIGPLSLFDPDVSSSTSTCVSTPMTRSPCRR